MAARNIRCPKCEESLQQSPWENPCFQCKNCSTFLNENYACHQEPEMLDHSDEAVEEGERRTESWFSDEHDSFSKSSDESNQLRFSRGIETPFRVKTDTEPLYRKRDQPKQMRAAHVMYKSSITSDKPLYSPRFQEKKDTFFTEESYDLTDNIERFSFNPSQVLPYHSAATRQLFRPKSHPNHRSNKKLDDVTTTVSQGHLSDTPISSKICDPMGQEEAASIKLQSLISPNQQFPANNNVTNRFNFLFLDDDQSHSNEDSDTMTKEEDPLAFRGRQIRKTSKCQTADDLQQDNSSAKAEKASTVDLKNKVTLEAGLPHLPSKSGSKSFWTKFSRGKRQGSEVDLWDPDVAAFTMSQELNPTGLCDTDKWSFDPQDLWPAPSSGSVLEPVIESNETASHIAAPEQQPCVQQASIITSKHQLFDPQSMWLLEKLHQLPLSAAKNLHCSTEAKSLPSNLSNSFESSLSSMEKSPVDIDIEESFDSQQSELQLQSDLDCTLGEPKERSYPPLPSVDDPPYVRCQHCAAVLVVPQALFPYKKTVQKLRCGACWKVSIFSVLQLTDRIDQSMHDTDPDPINATVHTSADIEKSANNLTHCQETTPPRKEGGIVFLYPANPQDFEDPLTGVSFVETKLPINTTESKKQSGSCESVNSDHSKIPKARDTKAMHSCEFSFSNSTKILPGQDTESDIEFTSNSSEKEAQGKSQVSTGPGKRFPFSSKPASSSTSSGSSSSDEFLTNSSLLAKALACSGTRFSAKGPDNLFFNSHEKNSEKNYGNNFEKNYEKKTVKVSEKSLHPLVHSPGSPDFSFTKFSGALSFSAGSALWGSPLSDLYDKGPSLRAHKETQSSRDGVECDVRGLTKGLKCLLKSTRKLKTQRHHEHKGGFTREVYVNGEFIPDSYVKEAEHLAGPICSGSYWYDIYAGFWGVSGGPCMGIIAPGIEEFDHRLSRDCSSGNTDILVNGRELHKLDLKKLVQRGLPSTRGKAYRLFIDGRVFEEASGVEGQGLGKLAPTVERRACGYGMFMSIAS